MAPLDAPSLTFSDALSTVLNAIPVAVGILNTDGKMVFCNPPMRVYVSESVALRDERWRGWSHDGRLLGPSEWPIARALTGETVQPGLEMQFETDDGRWNWTRFSAAPLRAEDGTVIGAVATVEDLEQRVTKERMDEFSAFVGHDLKSPLRKIASFTKLLSDKITDRPAEDERHLLDRIFQSTTQAERLTDVLMRFARDGGSDESMSDVDMNAVADSVRISLEDQIHDAGALFRVDSLPVVRGRAFALERLLQNLVSNALKYGGDRPFVHLSASRDGQMWCFRVKDNGVGIPSEMLAGIFDLYDRGDTGSEDGHGVGLAICRQIVESHGGRIWANSSPARGSTFYFTVPG